MRTIDVAELADLEDESGLAFEYASRWGFEELEKIGRGYDREWTVREALAYVIYRRCVQIGGSWNADGHSFGRRLSNLVLRLPGPLVGLEGQGVWSDGEVIRLLPLRRVAELFSEQGGWAIPLGQWEREVRDRALLDARVPA